MNVLLVNVRAVAVASVLAASCPLAGRAEQIPIPPDPIAPTSMAECDALYAEYRAIWQRFYDEMRRLHEQATEVLRLAGVTSESIEQNQELHRRASEAAREGGRALSLGSRARSRCEQQVRAYERNQAALERDEMAETRAAIDAIPGNVGSDLVERLTPSWPGLDDVAEEVSSRPLQIGLGAADKAYDLYQTIDRARQGEGLEAWTEYATDRVADRAGFDPARRFVFDTSMQNILAIHRAALADMSAAFQRYDGGTGAPSSTSARLAASLGRQANLGDVTRIGPGGEPPSDGLMAAIDRLEEVSQEIDRLRGEGSAEAMRSVAEFRAELEEIAAEHARQLAAEQAQREAQRLAALEARRAAEEAAWQAEEFARQQAIAEQQWLAEQQRLAEAQWRAEQQRMQNQMMMDVFVGGVLGALAGGGGAPAYDGGGGGGGSYGSDPELACPSRVSC